MSTNKLSTGNFPSSYREVKIGRTTYYVTSVYKGEKELGQTLEKLAARHIIDQLDKQAKELFSA